MKLHRLQVLLAALWGGVMLAVGGLAAPSLFMVLDRHLAGQAAGRIFTLEAKFSLAMAMVLFMLERRRVRDLAESGAQGLSAMSGNVMLVLGALFLAIFGEFVLHPQIEAAKAGQITLLSFGALHGLSSALYWLRIVLVCSLAWRLTGLSRPPSGQGG